MVSATKEDVSGPQQTNWKVGRIIAKYGLYELDRELVRRWGGDDPDQCSLRELAEYFNKSVLEAALNEAGASTHDEELEYRYRMLTDSNITSGMRTEIIRDIENRGVDYEEVEQEFVTHQAIYTYLTNYHNVEYNLETENQIEKDLKTINQLRSRTNAVVESTIERLNNTDRISIENEGVIVDINVICHDCGVSYGVSELLSERSCECGDA